MRLRAMALCGLLALPLPAQECDPCSFPQSLYCLSEDEAGPKRSTWDKENDVHFYYKVLGDLPSGVSLVLSTDVRLEALGHLPGMFSVYADLHKSGVLGWSRIKAHLYFDTDMDRLPDEHYLLQARWDEARDFYKGTLRTLVREARSQERPLEYLVDRLEEISVLEEGRVRGSRKAPLFQELPVSVEDRERYVVAIGRLDAELCVQDDR